MEFKLPELGEGVHEGELVRWLVKPGDMVKDDQPLCEIMTDKATIEIPSPFHGTVKEIHIKEGAVVKVGETMVSYDGAAGASASSAAAKPASAPAPTAPKGNGHSAPTPSKPAASAAPAQMSAASTTGATSGGAHVSAAPSTRRYAREQGVELNRVPGSGPHGRVMREDVDRARSGGGGGAPLHSSGAMATVSPSAGRTFTVPPGLAGGEQRIPFKGLRKKIAEKMRLSKDKAAHFTYVEEADASELVRLRSQAKEIGAKSGVKVTYLPFIMKAMVAALRQHPTLNAALDEERNEVVVKHYFNIGLSIQTEDGLTAPVVKNVEHKSVLELARDIQDIVERARTKRLTIEDFHGGTITLTNAGSIGGLFATPILNFPEVAILGFNKIFKKPVVKTINGVDQVVIRDWTYFSISLDHRIVDGAVGAEFMNTFIKYIENPSLLLLESF